MWYFQLLLFGKFLDSKRHFTLRMQSFKFLWLLCSRRLYLSWLLITNIRILLYQINFHVYCINKLHKLNKTTQNRLLFLREAMLMCLLLKGWHKVNFKFHPASYKYTTSFQSETTIRYTNTKILAWGKYQASMYQLSSCTKTPYTNWICMKKLKILHKLLLLMFLYFIEGQTIQHFPHYLTVQPTPRKPYRLHNKDSILRLCNRKKKSFHVLRILFC